MTFIIAEIGINHNGNLDIAKKLIDAAKWAGADAVKFQKRDINIVYAGQLDKPRESPWGKTNGDQKRGLEFNELQYDLIASYCESIKMPWFASAWDIPSLEFLRKYDCPWNKVASAMVKNIEFLAAVSWEHKPTFISTAMCDYDDIDRAVKIFSRNISSSSLTLMHCVGTYPCREEDLNLNMIPTLAKRYIYPIGYSGHEASVSPSVMAVVLGATAVERHITLDRSMYGSDQAASLEPHGFKSMVDQIRKVPEVLGDGIKRILPAEAEVAKKLRYFE
jgi:N-acetylneuraminate synthase